MPPRDLKTIPVQHSFLRVAKYFYFLSSMWFSCLLAGLRFLLSTHTPCFHRMTHSCTVEASTGLFHRRYWFGRSAADRTHRAPTFPCGARWTNLDYINPTSAFTPLRLARNPDNAVSTLISVAFPFLVDKRAQLGRLRRRRGHLELSLCDRQGRPISAVGSDWSCASLRRIEISIPRTCSWPSNSSIARFFLSMCKQLSRRGSLAKTRDLE